MLLVMTGIAVMSSASKNPSAKHDWPRFLGPHGNGISDETGLLRSWPEKGPQEIWRVPIGTGYSGLAISNGRIYTMDSRKEAEYLVCLNAENGREIWRNEVGPLFKEQLMAMGDGPRSTPTIDGEVVYALSASGHLRAATMPTGATIWKIDVKEEFEFDPPQWWYGFSSSPFIDQNMLLLNVGGKGSRSIAALDKKTGETIWAAHQDIAAYSTPIAIEFGGTPQRVFVTGLNVVSVSREGKILWRYPWDGGSFLKIAKPVFVPPDKIFVSASYGIGAVLLQMQPQGDSLAVHEVWKSKVMANHFQTSLLLGKYLYGFDDGTLKCLEAETGKEMWAKRQLGKGSLICADRMLIILSERGQLVLAEANPQQYVELASAQVLTGRTWTPPSLANGRLYLRHQSEVVCLKLK
jgi:outer membrane protein assembly factor BamB